MNALGEAATAALVKAAEGWPAHVEIQQILAPAVREYQELKARAELPLSRKLSEAQKAAWVRRREKYGPGGSRFHHGKAEAARARAPR